METTNYINKKWKKVLNIGRKHHYHYLDVQRNALLNAFSFLAILISIIVTILYSILGFSNKYIATPMIPMGLLILWLNKNNKLRLSKNLAFFGCLFMITLWCFYTRRTGASLLYITLAACCASIFTNRKMIFIGMILCSVFYFVYQYYDHVVPFVIDPRMNYVLVNTILTYVTAGFTFFQVLLYVDLTYNFSKSIDKKYKELNLAYEKQKNTEEKLKTTNDELLGFNKKLDYLIKETNEELYSYQTAIDDNLYSIITDLNGKILKINDRYLATTKYSREELIGEDYSLLYSNFHSDDFYNSINKRLKRGKVWRGETKQKAKDGTLFWIISSILPIIDKKSKTTTSYFTISADITDKKLAEEKEKLAVTELTKSQNRFSLLLENQTDLVIIRNETGIRKYVNRAFCDFFGKDSDFFIETNYKTHLPQSQLYTKTFETLSFENPKISFQEVLKNAKNETRWIKWDGVALFDDNQKITEILSIGHDITELKEKEFQNAKYIAQFEEMAFKNSHKFRGPLSNIIGILNLFESDDISENETLEMNDWIKNAINDLDNASVELTSFIDLYHKESKSLENKTEASVDFDIAKSKHLNWKYKIKNFLDGSSSLTRIEAVSYQISDLGKWYYGEGKAKYGHLPSMQEFETEHKILHQIIAEILQLRAIGNPEKVELKYKLLQKTSDKIFLLLDEAERAMKK
jgi:PAS domain S-box-containing protein